LVPFIAFSQFGADQHAVAEFQCPEMLLDAGEIVLAQFSVEHREKRSEAL